MNDLGKKAVTKQEIREDASGQRIDNYLLKVLKGVPKSHIYRILRSGEVRVNGGRVGPDYRLGTGDAVRIPPLRLPQRTPRKPPTNPELERAILFEDEYILALNKPPGLAVHGGSGINFGVIEQMRAQRPAQEFLELVHRLDRDTSGVLLLAKRRSALVALHANLRAGHLKKHYLVLVKGKWRNARQNVHLNLSKHVLSSGERRVSIDPQGQDAHTVFELKRAFDRYSLLQAELKTGRTHQIRVHLAHLGYPIVGDDKYGDFKLNKEIASAGVKRMFLHAASICFEHPKDQKMQTLTAPLPDDFTDFLDGLHAPLSKEHDA